MTIEKLLEELEQQISYLARSTMIPGMEAADIKQELRMAVVIDYPKFNDEKYNKGWWFKRLKWCLINLSNREKKEPINRSVRLDRLKENG